MCKCSDITITAIENQEERRERERQRKKEREREVFERGGVCDITGIKSAVGGFQVRRARYH